MRDVRRRVATTRDRFNQIAARITAAVGSPVVLAAAFGLIVVWALSGPFFGFSDGWQLVINTTTTIITFLMVFVIQASQNRDSKALHLKLDEVIRAVHGARNELIAAEKSDEAEIREREEEFLRIAEHASRAALSGVPDPGGEPAVSAGHAVEAPGSRTAEPSAAERAEREADPPPVPRARATPAKHARGTDEGDGSSLSTDAGQLGIIPEPTTLPTAGPRARRPFKGTV